MADEQIIYLSPEEELTSVRERLERVQSKHIILVIPTQTQLRSHVSWRLLHARARELNKDILIISSDRQIRSVVKAAGFRVADSLESPPSSKNRTSSRSSGRSSMGGKTSARLKTPPGRNVPDQSGQLRQRNQDTSAPDVDLDRTDQLRRPSQSLDPDSVRARRDNTFKSVTPPASSTFGEDDSQFGPEINYSITDSSTPPVTPIQPLPPLTTPPGTPSIHPLDASYQDEDPDLFLEDFQRAQSIRRAAQKHDLDKMPPPPVSAVSPEAPPIFDLSPSDKVGHDPLLYDEDDDDAVSLPEQHASVAFHDLDDDSVDITHDTTHGLQIEDVSEQDYPLPYAGSQPYSSAGTGSQADEEDEDTFSPSRIHNLRPRANRTGKIPVPPQPPSQPPELDEEEAYLPPIYERPTQDMPSPQTGRQSGVLGTRERDPQPIPLVAPRPVPSKSVQSPTKKQPDTARKTSVSRNTGKTQTISRASASAKQAQSKKRRSGGIALPLIVGVLIVLLIGLLAFLWPSANVIVTLPSHNYPVQMSLTASATSRQDTALKTLPAQTLIFDTSVTGTGHATGSTTVGTIQADGNVTFTNNDKNSQVVIPSNTIVATKSGIQFGTQAEALVLPSSTVIVPIKAQNAGANGNVPAGSITVIPATSLTAIQQANPSGTTVNLSVTNTDPTTHGGAGSATALTTTDVNTEKSALDIQIQAKVKDFLAKNVQTSDQPGQAVQVETPVPTPAVGSVVTSGIFTETLKLHMTILVVRAADLQAAAIAQLKNTLNTTRTNLALVPQQPVLFKQIKNSSPKDGSLVKLSFTAIGQVAPQVSEDIVRNLVSGKSVSDAQQALVGKNGIPGVTHVQISVNPNFFHWLPFWTQRINVHFQAVPQPTTPTPTKHPKHP